MAPFRYPFAAEDIKVLIAIDVGTTYSGATYAVIRPHQEPFIRSVSVFPGQPVGTGSFKIPTLVLYDQGVLQAAGAEATDENTKHKASLYKWQLVEHFKLCLDPTSERYRQGGFRLDSLPQGKTPVEVYGDFYGYMFKCTTDYIARLHEEDADLIDASRRNAHFILTHPNGWGPPQLHDLRQSAIHGGLVTGTVESYTRITLASEGEASLHACLANPLVYPTLKIQDPFIVADLGGGTLDLNSYEVVSTSPLAVQEIVAPESRLAGSMFINGYINRLLGDKLRGTKYDNPELVEHAIEDVEASKRNFSDNKQASWVRIEAYNVTNDALFIKAGKLKLTGPEMEKCFEHTIEHTIDAILRQKRFSERPKIEVWLVGGLASSDWLWTMLKQRLDNRAFSVRRLETNGSKAASDGAIHYYLNHAIKSRIAKCSMGVEYYEKYNENDEAQKEHLGRPQGARTTQTPSGSCMIGPKFKCFIVQGERLTAKKTVTHSFTDEITSAADTLRRISIIMYRQSSRPPEWIDDDKDNFTTHSIVEVDLKEFLGKPHRGPSDGPFWRLKYDIEFKLDSSGYDVEVKRKHSVWPIPTYGHATIRYDDPGTLQNSQQDPIRAPWDKRPSILNSILDFFNRAR